MNVIIRCGRCRVQIGIVDIKSDKTEIELYCPECIEDDALMKGATLEQAKQLFMMRRKSLDKLQWKERTDDYPRQE